MSPRKYQYLTVLGFLVIWTTVFRVSLPGEVEFRLDEFTRVKVNALFRGYLLNDQRLQWSGQEITFGVESNLGAEIERRYVWGEIRISSQFFLNQPFDENILTDETREKYIQNFQVDVLEVKQLYIEAEFRNWSLGIGKHATLFGRDLTRNFSNSYFDYAFIRNEAILAFETGVFFRFSKGVFRLDAAVTNGSENLDNNQMKAGIIRAGLAGKEDHWAAGISAKYHNGIGSEWQKRFNNHVGIDFMWKKGAFQVAGELIYDEYGFRREFDIDDVFWSRSYYYRDLYYKRNVPITGVGGYIDLQYEKSGFPMFFELIFSDYYPRQLGNPYHDDPIRRTILKIRYSPVTHLELFAIGLFENYRQEEPLFKGASDVGFLVGAQYRL